jgi:hypothetical protein
MVLAGLVLWRSVGGRVGLVLGVTPGLLMGVTVIVTGNHYWIDGVVGAAFTLAPAIVLLNSNRILAALRAVRIHSARGWQSLSVSRKAQATTIGFTGLLVYLLVGQVVSPGFTDHWGYLVFQTAGILLLLLFGEVKFADQGGLSWQTHLIAVAASFADTLGTAGDAYANYREYDKIVHFTGIAVVSSAAYDCLRAMNRRDARTWRGADRLVTAVSIGIATGVGWEAYEYLGDNVFHSTRIGGFEDTAYDLIFDSFGAIVAGVLLWWADVREDEEAREGALEEG